MSNAESTQCGFLNYVRPGQVSYPDSIRYQFEESQYWSQQQALTEPTCRYSPENATDVSLGILTVQVADCKFAVKSGGHAAFSGASNIQDGMTIDLINLNQITISDDQTQTSVGSGLVWYDIYTELEPMGLSVIGGRVSAIGTGGFTLGGGISFFSGRYGWACDNVNTYEVSLLQNFDVLPFSFAFVFDNFVANTQQVVFADGSINEVSYAAPYEDLYYALRGGGNNFGVVTRFDLVTFPQGEMWAGGEVFIYNNETAAELNEAFYWLGENAPCRSLCASHPCICI